MTGDPAQGRTTARPSREDRSEPGAASWIEDDELLRDEGVVFGLSGTDELPESKLESVRAYFRARTARSEAEREALADERGHLERRLEDLRPRIGAFEQRLPAIVERDEYGPDAAPTPHRFLRYATGVLLAAAVCTSAYFVVRDLLGDGFAQPELVALGVTLAGLFVVFGPVSLLYGVDRRQSEGAWATELWKARLVEFGMPAAAAFFVVAWGESGSFLRDVGAFLFLGMLFLVGGRLLLSLLPRTAEEFRRYRRARRRRRRRDALGMELTAMRDRASALEDRIAAIGERLGATPSPEELEALCEHKIALLRSEFELARRARGEPTEDADAVPIPAGEEDAS